MPHRFVVPHVVPYQGSKRLLAPAIAGHMRAHGPIRRLYEPFCGSAAVTLYAAFHGLAERFVLGDRLPALVELWRQIVQSPHQVASHYAALHAAQHEGGVGEYGLARSRFNAAGDPKDFLWLCARCVKNAVRFGSNGQFNQSPDRRRRGTEPLRMAKSIAAASQLLVNKTEFRHSDWQATLADATIGDLVYLDPPYAGTSSGADPRYVASLDRQELIAGLRALHERGVTIVLSYDGRTGDKSYAEHLPADLGLRRVELDAGRSAQATLLGRSERTVESLYLSVARAG